MIKDVVLKAEPRNLVGKKVKQIRREGKLPVVVYGKKIQPQNLVVDEKEFNDVYQQAGGNTLVSLTVGDQANKVLIHGIQKHPVTDSILHADLYQVKMDEKIRTEVPIVLVGVSSAVEDKEANLVKNKTSIEIEALPNDLIHEIEIDISALREFGDSIHVSDIKVPSEVEILDDLQEIIVLAQEPISEEELEKMEEEAAADTEKAQIEKIEEEAEKEKGEKEEEVEAAEETTEAPAEVPAEETQSKKE